MTIYLIDSDQFRLTYKTRDLDHKIDNFVENTQFSINPMLKNKIEKKFN
jgi:hypothetical protein